MNDVKFELDYNGVGNLLKSAEMQKVLLEHANRISDGKGKADVKVLPTRAVARARGDDGNNSLLKRARRK